VVAGFSPKTDVQAISHLNVVVDDIEAATERAGRKNLDRTISGVSA
jgi:hypothetical protein